MRSFIQYIKQRVKSFNYAINGLKIVIKDEPNFRIHLFVAILIIGLSLYLKFSQLEWIVILFAIGFVLVSELINTAIENMADFMCQEENDKIKRIKNIAAGAVLMSVFTAIIIGMIVFIPKLF